MSHYKSNLRDLEFNLFEVFGQGDGGTHPVLGTGPFADIDADTARILWAFMVRKGLIIGSPFAGVRSGRINPSLIATNSVNVITLYLPISPPSSCLTVLSAWPVHANP